MRKAIVWLALLLCSHAGWAFQDGHIPSVLPAVGTIQVAFTPGDDAGALVITAIHQARRQILVQAFSFTHRAIADALIAAHRRGVDVTLIVDSDQAERIPTSVVKYIAAGGVPVYLDGEHRSAHNKIMVIDADTAPVVITGSYNFTHAAQYRNAENLLVLRGNPALAQTYAANWQRHREHAVAFEP
ncbi:MAG: phospholipase D family nuclease [Sulfuriferula sp.]